MKKYILLTAMILLFLPGAATEFFRIYDNSDIYGDANYYETQNAESIPSVSPVVLSGSTTSSSDLIALAAQIEQNNALIREIRNEIANLRELLYSTDDPLLRNIYLLQMEEYEKQLVYLSMVGSSTTPVQEALALSVSNTQNLLNILSNIMSVISDFFHGILGNLR